MSGAGVSESLRAPAEPVQAARAGSPGVPQLGRFACSLADQVFSVGGMFAVNIALARVRSKEEYGVFTLAYSLFTFLAGLHNAAILEAYTIYGSGRYRGRFARYERFLARHNGWLLAGVTLALAALWQGLRWVHPEFASRPLLGMALTSGVLLSAAFKRRTFYIQRRPDLAVRFSSAFFLGSLTLLGLAIWAGLLDGLTAFLIVAAAWSLAFLFTGTQPDEERKLAMGGGLPGFLADEPGYWLEHWKYSRWVFVTALVFQFTTQAYFWVVAWFLSVRDVAGLRALYNLALPVEQVFAAISLLVLPAMASLFASGELEKLRRLWRRCSLAYFAIGAAFALAVGLLSRPLLHLVYGGKFDDVAPLLRWYVLVPVVMGVGHAANAALKAMERPQAVFYAYLASGVTTLLAGSLLVIRFGLRGAIDGMLLSGLSYAAVLTVSAYRLNRPIPSDKAKKIWRFAGRPER